MTPEKVVSLFCQSVNAFKLAVLLVLSFLGNSQAQDVGFFRISGPAATTIAALQADGSLIWSNAQPGAIFTVQKAVNLAGGTNWVDYVQLPTTNSTHTNQIIDSNPPVGMALIPAGSFQMGDALDGESDALPVHTVYVSAFYIDVNLVSFSQWQAVYNWATNNGYSFDNAGRGKAANHPVYDVNWYDCVKWCNARSQQAGLTPVYYSDSGFTQVYTNGDTDSVFANWTAKGYRLPTEAEWEKAARGGLSGKRFPWGNTISWSQANYQSDPLSLNPYGYAYDLAIAFGDNPAYNDGVAPYSSPVGSFAANGYGLYDMAGNSIQWCWDLFDSGYYSVSPSTDPTGPDSSPDSLRLLRGGSWNSDAYNCRLPLRLNTAPDHGFFPFGFRSVLRLGQ